MSLDIQFIRSFGNMELLAKQAIEGFMTGLHKSPFHGFSVEFAEHKQYNTGESTKHIDWKVYAKTDRLYTRHYEEETNLRCQFVIDVSSSMYYPEDNFGKITYAAYACASLAYLLHKQRDAVGITLFNEHVIYESPIKSTSAHLQHIFSMLEEIIESKEEEKTTILSETLSRIAEKKNRRNLIVIFSDLLGQKDKLEEFFLSLQHLKHNLHEIIIFQVNDHKTEFNLELEDRPHRLFDLETNEKIDLTPEQVQHKYQQSVKNYFKEIKMFCGKYKIDFVEVDINDPLNDIIMTYLMRRRKIK